MPVSTRPISSPSLLTASPAEDLLERVELVRLSVAKWLDP
jgi:hypothetical protein